MKTVAVVLGVVVLALAARRFSRRGRDGMVSPEWLAAHRDAERTQYDGIAWRWPVRKLLNDAGRFNRERLRRRA